MPLQKSKRGPAWWARLKDEKLLDLRFCDLGLTLDDSPVATRVRELYEELKARGLQYRPPCWLSSDWFSPTEGPGIAIPFYLAHSRLMRLEDRQMFSVEGGTKTWCMQLLRHEAGHAYETAYRLTRRPRWRKTFGSASRPYPEYYRPKPFSKSYVLHLDWWYAQSHPTEDFAETFAVWLKPGSTWRKDYQGWRAFKKLVYVDELMTELSRKAPLCTDKSRMDDIRDLEMTLREHYAEKKSRYETDYPEFYDRDLRKLFSAPGECPRRTSAAAFLRKVWPQLRGLVSQWTGESPYTVNLVLKDMVVRCRELDLWVDRPENEIYVEAAIMLTMQTMNYVHSSDHRVVV